MINKTNKQDNKRDQEYIKTLMRLVPYNTLKGEFEEVKIKTSISYGNVGLNYRVNVNRDKVIIRSSNKTPVKTGHTQTEEKERKTQKARIYLIKPKKTRLQRVYTQIIKFIYPRDTKHIQGYRKKGMFQSCWYSAVDKVPKEMKVFRRVRA